MDDPRLLHRIEPHVQRRFAQRRILIPGEPDASQLPNLSRFESDLPEKKFADACRRSQFDGQREIALAVRAGIRPWVSGPSGIEGDRTKDHQQRQGNRASHHGYVDFGRGAVIP